MAVRRLADVLLMMRQFLRRRWLVVAMASVFLAGPVANARGQGVLEALREAERQQDRVEQPSKPAPMTPEEACLIAEKNSGASKCRGYYLSSNYVPQWSGLDRSITHGLMFEVLTRGDDAVICYNLLPLNDWSPCTALDRSK